MSCLGLLRTAGLCSTSIGELALRVVPVRLCFAQGRDHGGRRKDCLERFASFYPGNQLSARDVVVWHDNKCKYKKGTEDRLTSTQEDHFAIERNGIFGQIRRNTQHARPIVYRGQLASVIVDRGNGIDVQVDEIYGGAHTIPRPTRQYDSLAARDPDHFPSIRKEILPESTGNVGGDGRGWKERGRVDQFELSPEGPLA